MAGSPRTIGKRITTNHNRTREDAKTLCALSFAYSPQGKKKTQRQSRKGKARQENKPRSNKSKAPKQSKQRNKRKAKKRKTEANTPRAFNPPNFTRVQRPHKPRKAPRQHKPTQNKRNPTKTALKCEIEAYSQATHQSKSSKGTKGGNTRPEERTTTEEPTTCHKWTPPKGRHERPQPAPTLHPHFKNILGFCPLLSPKIPRKHQATPNKI